MCLRAIQAYDFFQICHCAELNKIVEAMMPVNPHDDRKVSLRRPHGNGDLDIIRASYTRRKANVSLAKRWRNFHSNEVCTSQPTLSSYKIIVYLQAIYNFHMLGGPVVSMLDYWVGR